MNYTDFIDIAKSAKVSGWDKTKLSVYVGGLSNPSKMPCHGYSISARRCKTGAKLRKVNGSTCSGCYAMRGNYQYDVVKVAHERRYKSLTKAYWVAAMSELITRTEKSGYFRWHDSGDLQSVEHFAKICAVAAMTPEIKHWIPTREYRIVSDYLKNGGEIPENLTVRMSAHMLGGKVPTFPAPLVISSVSRNDSVYSDAHHCPARFQNNSCEDCRACWNPEIAHVDYHAH